MVIERFKNNDPAPVGERFRARGRLIPGDSGASFVSSWMTADGHACYQLMEAPTRESLNAWISAWNDLVDFEVVPVVPSAEFWAAKR